MAAAFEPQSTCHHTASLTSARLPSLPVLRFITSDPDPFPSGCAQPSSAPLFQPHPRTPQNDSADISTPLGPAFLGSVYTMGDSSRREMVSLGKVQRLPAGESLPGILGKLQDSPLGRAVERGLLWWVNRGREKPRFEFFLDKETAGKHVDKAQRRWPLSPAVLSSTVVECSLKEAYSCTKINSDAFNLVPDEKQVRAAKRIIRRQHGRRAAKSFRGTPIFAAYNFTIVVPSADGVRWYTPCFLNKAQLHTTLDHSIDLHFEGLIRTRRARRYSSLDPGGSSGGLGGPPADAEGMDEESGLMDPNDMKDFMEEAPPVPHIGVDKILFNLAAVYAQDFFDDLVLGNKWARHAVGLQPYFHITVDSFEDCTAAAEAASIARERFHQRMAKRSESSEMLTSAEGGASPRWGRSAQRGAPPGSSLLGGVVREADEKRAGETNPARGRKGFRSEEGSEFDEGGRSPGRSEGDLPDQSKTNGIVTNRSSADLSGKDSGLGTSENLADKPWWEIILEHPAFKKEASQGVRKPDGLVVNKGPGWEIVRRGPFWNRQYVLEQVAEEEASSSGQKRELSDGPKSNTEALNDQESSATSQDRVIKEEANRGSSDVSQPGRGTDEFQQRDGSLREYRAQGAGSRGDRTPREEGQSPLRRPSRGPAAHRRSGSVKGQGNVKYMSQAEWDAVKAAVKKKLKESRTSGGDLRHLKREALKALVEAKLALKYREEDSEFKHTGGDGCNPSASKPRSWTDETVLGVGTRVEDELDFAKRSRRKEPWERNAGEERRSKRDDLIARRRAERAAAEAHLGAAGVLRQEARMALVAVAAGSPQEKDLQAAMDAVARDIRGKSANGAEASLMFIADASTLFAPIVQAAPGQGRML